MNFVRLFALVVAGHNLATICEAQLTFGTTNFGCG